MRRMTILGFTLLLIAGCGGGGGDELMTTEPDPPEPGGHATLSTLGEIRSAPINGVGDAFTTMFHSWGIWGGVLRDDAVSCEAIGCPPPGDTIFMAFLNHEMDGTVSTTVRGTRSGTSPESGSAVWSGNVHAYETEDVATSGGTSVTTYAAVTGEAQLAVDFADVTVDVHFTNFDSGQTDMSWVRLAVNNGGFGNGVATIDGSFYGEAHEGATGTFERDGLRGVFGALRSAD